MRQVEEVKSIVEALTKTKSEERVLLLIGKDNCALTQVLQFGVADFISVTDMPYKVYFVNIDQVEEGKDKALSVFKPEDTPILIGYHDGKEVARSKQINHPTRMTEFVDTLPE